MRKTILTVLLLILLSPLAHAACENLGGGFWRTDGNEAADVNECITAASAGDTINVIAGDGAATWAASAITIPADKPVKLIGPGRDNLTITAGGSGLISIGAYIGTSQIPATRISGFSFYSPVTGRAFITATGQGWRIDNCQFFTYHTESDYAGAMGIYTTYAWDGTTLIQTYGLVDNNIFINCGVSTVGSINYGGMSQIWAEDTDLGTGNAVYIEDNTFQSSTSIRKLVCDPSQGGKNVFRYNTTERTWVLVHGVQSDSTRGGRKIEVYGNTFNLSGGGSRVPIQLKAGTDIVFNNDITSPTDPWVSGVEVYHERDVYKSAWPVAGICDGDSIWDTIIGAGYLCRDQIGAGKDAFVWVVSTAYQDNFVNTRPIPDQSREPFYTWGVLDGGSYRPVTRVSGQSANILKDRDYYEYDPTNCAAGGASCTAGVGVGTLANRPVNCSIGTAYWATNFSATDLTGLVGVNPTLLVLGASPGTLYKCVSANVWSTVGDGFTYTPYTYPHPLRGESTPVTTIPQGVHIGGGIRIE